MSTILNHCRCETDIAFDGQDAVPLIQSTRYDMIVLDWSMPRMGGSETLMLLEQSLPRKTSRLHKIPVLIYTSFSLDELDLPDSQHFRYVGHLKKNQSFGTIFKSLQNTLSLI
jgi:CheY-like chemotaxis protein